MNSFNVLPIFFRNTFKDISRDSSRNSPAILQVIPITVLRIGLVKFLQNVLQKNFQQFNVDTWNNFHNCRPYSPIDSTTISTPEIVSYISGRNSKIST